jgi:hypothetical protein
MQDRPDQGSASSCNTVPKEATEATTESPEDDGGHADGELITAETANADQPG